MVKSQFIIIKNIIHSIIFLIVLSISNNIKSKENMYKSSNDIMNHKESFLIQVSEDQFKQIVQNVDVQSRLMKQYSNWKGVRYHLGGENQYGIDCSAFVQRTFYDQFGIRIPRSTSEQQNTGKNILRNELRPGDLILFHNGNMSRHIGIYLGNNYFIHVSTKYGVMISNLNNHYWSKRYCKACRVLAKNFS